MTDDDGETEHTAGWHLWSDGRANDLVCQVYLVTVKIRCVQTKSKLTENMTTSVLDRVILQDRHPGPITLPITIQPCRQMLRRVTILPRTLCPRWDTPRRGPWRWRWLCDIPPSAVLALRSNYPFAARVFPPPRSCLLRGINVNCRIMVSNMIPLDILRVTVTVTLLCPFCKSRRCYFSTIQFYHRPDSITITKKAKNRMPSNILFLRV